MSDVMRIVRANAGKALTPRVKRMLLAWLVVAPIDQNVIQTIADGLNIEVSAAELLIESLWAEKLIDRLKSPDLKLKYARIWIKPDGEDRLAEELSRPGVKDTEEGLATQAERSRAEAIEIRAGRAVAVLPGTVGSVEAGAGRALPAALPVAVVPTKKAGGESAADTKPAADPGRPMPTDAGAKPARRTRSAVAAVEPTRLRDLRATNADLEAQVAELRGTLSGERQAHDQAIGRVQAELVEARAAQWVDLTEVGMAKRLEVDEEVRRLGTQVRDLTALLEAGREGAKLARASRTEEAERHQQALAAVRDDLDRVTAERTDLERQLKAAGSRLAARAVRSSEVTAAQAEAARLTTRVAELEAGMELSQARIAELEALATRYEAEVLEALDMAAANDRAVPELVAAQGDLKGIRAELKTARAAADRQRSRADGLDTTLKAERTDRRRAGIEATKSVAALESEVAGLRRELTKAEAAGAETITRLRADLEAARTELATARSERSRAVAEARRQSTRADALKVSKTEASRLQRRERAAAGAEVARLSALVGSLRAQLELEQRQHDEAVAGLRAELEAAAADHQLVALQARLDRLRQRADLQIAELEDRLAAALAQTESERAEALRAREVAERQALNLAGRLDALAETVTELKQRLKNANAQRTVSRTQAARAVAARDRARADLRDTRALLSQAESRLTAHADLLVAMTAAGVDIGNSLRWSKWGKSDSRAVLYLLRCLLDCEPGGSVEDVAARMLGITPADARELFINLFLRAMAELDISVSQLVAPATKSTAVRRPATSKGATQKGHLKAVV